MEFPNLMHHCFKVFSDLNRVRKLLAGGLDPNHQTYGGTTPFHWACMNPAPNIEVVRCLIQAGADINLENHMGYTPLHFAVIQRKRLVAKELIEQGALINAQNYLGMSALHFAVSDFALFGTPILDRTHLDIWIVKMLLKHQYINRDLINSNGDTPLMLSVKDYHIESAVQLLRSKANQNICNKDFQTPLHVALTHPPSDIEIELLICGANLYAVDRHGITPLDILMKFTLDDENEEWIHKPVVDRLAEDIYPDYFVEILYLVCELFAREMNTKHYFYGGTAPFRWACMSPAHSIEVVRCMIQAGADINLANHLGYAPLHFAVIQWKRLVAKEFIEHGALINAQNYPVTSALHFAVSDCSLFVTPILDRKPFDIWIDKKLLKHPCIDHDLLNSNGVTPLIFSCKGYHVEYAVQMLHSEANPNIWNKDFKISLHVTLIHPPSSIEVGVLYNGANI
ncbi:ankyrin-3-like [Argiope bruennichi]|uniref:ankyrin-3-like n=1 Tax=Argiope bruennichi TaxID=94029 RepID=UPI002493DE9F|nr:ankyrin-3-like [Argiope bruennichi]